MKNWTIAIWTQQRRISMGMNPYDQSPIMHNGYHMEYYILNANSEDFDHSGKIYRMI